MPSQVCILTDSTAQFPHPAFHGQELVHIIPLHIYYKGKCYQGGRDLKVQDLLVKGVEDEHPTLLAPTVEELRRVLMRLGQQHSQIVILMLSKHLNPAIRLAGEAIFALKGSVPALLIDSETCGIGLGLLVQAAAEAAKKGSSLAEINLLLRRLITRVYALFCLHDLTYLSRCGHLDPAQAIVGQMLGITPLYLLEYGRLFPVHKVRNPHHLMDLLQEFIYEFTTIQHIALVRGAIPFDQEARILKEHVCHDFPSISFSEHRLSPEMAAIFGPRSLGLVVLEG